MLVGIYKIFIILKIKESLKEDGGNKENMAKTTIFLNVYLLYVYVLLVVSFVVAGSDIFSSSFPPRMRGNFSGLFSQFQSGLTVSALFCYQTMVPLISHCGYSSLPQYAVCLGPNMFLVCGVSV